MKPTRRSALLAAVIAIMLAGLWSATSASAAPVFEAVKGDVRAQNLPAKVDLRVNAGTTISTGQNAQAIIRFDDGTHVVLDQNTEFRITDYRFSEAEKQMDRGVFELFKGAMRMVTGKIRAHHNTFRLQTPQATIGVRGTDFMVAVVNPAYVSVLKGAVDVSNIAGTAVFGSGSIAAVTSNSALAIPISASALPSAAADAFRNLSGAAVIGGGAAPGAATGAATSGAGVGSMIGIGAAAAAAAAALGSKGGGPTTHH